jgi:NAD(P)-dependent dehydrogenase (short-subunit alcohol dehydrogenase family)
MPTQDLSGTTALVTGASRGFGRAIAVALSKQGAHGAPRSACAGKRPGCVTSGKA